MTDEEKAADDAAHFDPARGGYVYFIPAAGTDPPIRLVLPKPIREWATDFLLAGMRIWETARTRAE